MRLLGFLEKHLVVQRHLVQGPLRTGPGDGVSSYQASSTSRVTLVQVLPVVKCLRSLHFVGVAQQEGVTAGHAAVEVDDDLLGLVGFGLGGLLSPEDVLYFKVHAGLRAEGGGAHGRARSLRLLRLRSISLSPDVDVVNLWDVRGGWNGVGVLKSKKLFISPGDDNLNLISPSWPWS